MNRISVRHLNGRPRPTPRILQFGGGNFLRGFIDWKIDRMNEAAGTDWGIVILRSVGGRDGSALNEQDGLYTVLSRGIGADGVAVSEARVIGAVREEIDCQADWARVLDLAARPEIEVILSNTTETGIVFDPAAGATDAPPASFPAKLTALLAHRWQTLGADAPGWQIIPCELTDRAGDSLAALGLDLIDSLLRDRSISARTVQRRAIVVDHDLRAQAGEQAGIFEPQPAA